MDSRFLRRRRQTWYVRVKVPRSLQAQLGTELVKTTGTRDLAEARRRRWGIVAALREQINTATESRQESPESPEWLLAEVRALMESVTAGHVSAEFAAEQAVDILVDKHVAAAKYERDPDTGHPIIPDPKAKRIVNTAMTLGGTDGGTLLSAAITDYLAEIKPRVQTSTHRYRSKALEEFKDFLGDGMIADTTRADAGRFLGSHLMKQGHSASTVKGRLSHLSAFYRWAVARGITETNVVSELSSTVRSSKRGGKATRRAWTEEELLTLIRGVDPTNQVWQIGVLCLYTGCRLNEIAELPVTGVHKTHIHIAEGKTDAAVRDIPLHPVIQPLVKRLAKASTDGFLLQGLQRAGVDDRRGHNLSKRFGNRIRALGIKDPAVVLHSLRNTFIQGMEQAAVPSSTAKLIVGHTRQDLTFGGYSHGVKMETLREAVGALSFGAVDALVAKVA